MGLAHAPRMQVRSWPVKINNIADDAESCFEQQKTADSNGVPDHAH